MNLINPSILSNLIRKCFAPFEVLYEMSKIKILLNILYDFSSNKIYLNLISLSQNLIISSKL